MPNDDNQNTNSAQGSDFSVQNNPTDLARKATDQSTSEETTREVLRRIDESHNVLIALSSDPSVDELAAAIGLSLFLGKNGKHATAIYSGETPNALEFLNPEQTFEPTVDALQDFVIAINKEKADHLRYKLDGEYVKIFITPYSSKITESDLDFSYGDYNIDLVITLDVANGIDLDEALREHGRIMHDASIINITIGNPGKFGEVEWSDKSASSVSEMIATMLYKADYKENISKDDATAFLTGIVAATNRFSNAATTPATMRLASRLMESGANQQLVAKNITPDTDNEMYATNGIPLTEEKKPNEPEEEFKDIPQEEPKSELKEEESKSELKGEEPQTEPEPEPEKEPQDITGRLDVHSEEGTGQEVEGAVNEKESTLLDDLKAAEASLASAGAEVVPDNSKKPIRFSQEPAASTTSSAEPTTPSAESVAPTVATPPAVEPVANPEPLNLEPEYATPVSPSKYVEETGPKQNFLDESEKTTEDTKNILTKGEKTINPPSDTGTFDSGIEEDYSKMIEDALSTNANANPAAIVAPSVPTSAESNNIPDINYMPMPDSGTIPPPPTPPIDMSNAPSAPMTPPPTIEAPNPVVAPQPAVPTPSTAQAAAASPSVAQSAATVSPVTPTAPTIPTVAPTPSAPVAPADPSAFQIPTS